MLAHVYFDQECHWRIFLWRISLTLHPVPSTWLSPAYLQCLQLTDYFCSEVFSDLLCLGQTCMISYSHAFMLVPSRLWASWKRRPSLSLFQAMFSFKHSVWPTIKSWKSNCQVNAFPLHWELSVTLFINNRFLGDIFGVFSKRSLHRIIRHGPLGSRRETCRQSQHGVFIYGNSWWRLRGVNCVRRCYASSCVWQHTDFSGLNVIKVYVVLLSCQCLSPEPPPSCACRKKQGVSTVLGEEEQGARWLFGMPVSGNALLLLASLWPEIRWAREMGQCDLPVSPGRRKWNGVSDHVIGPNNMLLWC